MFFIENKFGNDNYFAYLCINKNNKRYGKENLPRN